MEVGLRAAWVVCVAGARWLCGGDETPLEAGNIVAIDLRELGGGAAHWHGARARERDGHACAGQVRSQRIGIARVQNAETSGS
jgi:hypothetical protein